MDDYLPVQIGLAFLLDIMIGDPRWFPHPVRMIGVCIEYCEKLLRKLVPSERLAGMCLTFIIVIGTYLATYQLLVFFYEIRWSLGVLASIIIIFFSLSTRDLLKETGNVMNALKSGNLIKARKNLSRIVGRDTQDLNEEQIAMGCIETSAENIVDGIIAPLFYAFIGGPALAMAYKSINTLDSMVGYKNAKYINFGRASAKLDDIANYIPARIAAVVLPLASYFCGADYSNSVKILKRDGQKHPSPNSGIPEAAIAGALGIRLGGPSVYNDIPSEKPFIGDPQRDISFDDISNTSKIVIVSAIIAVTIGIAFLVLDGYLSMGGNDFILSIFDSSSPRIIYKIPSF